MSFDDIVRQNIARRQRQQAQPVTDLAEATDTTPANLGMEQPPQQQVQDVQARYGLFPYGNQYGFTKLNELIDEDGLDSQRRYDLQQQWFKNQENYIKQLPQEQQAEWSKVLDEIKAGDNVLKAYSTLGAKAESIGTGVARMQSGTDEVGARVLSHLDKTDGELENEIAAEHSDAYARYKVAKQNLEQMRLNSFNNPMLLADGSKLEDHLSKEDQESLAWFDSLLANKRTGTMYSDDANFLVKDALRARDHNIARANQKSQYAGAEERREAIRGAGKDEGVIGEVVETAKAAWNDPNAAFDVAFESTGANLLPQLVGIASGLITRSPMVYQFISSVGQAPSEIQGAVQETIQEKYQEKYGKSDLSQITPEELEAIYTENAKELNDSFNSGVRNAAIVATVEPLVAKGVGKVAAGFTKLSSSAKAKTLKALGISGAAATKFTGEGWEEAFGQIATNLADDKPWDEGVGNSFVMALLGVENIPNTVAVGKDVKNQLRDELGLGKSDNQSSDTDGNAVNNSADSTTDNQASSVEDTTVEAQTTPSQNDTTSQVTTQPQDNTPTEEAALYAEYRKLIEQRDNGEVSAEEFTQAESEILSKFSTEVVDPETGEITIGSTFDAKKLYQQGTTDENRSDNRDGTENVDGSSIQPGIDETNGSAAQSGSEISEPVSPAQTETPTEGYNQPNTQSVTNLVEQPNDNTAESSAVGIDGRTNETDGSGVERREPWQDGSTQDLQSAETTQFGDENSGVQQRTESNSSGETLVVPYAKTALEKGEVSSVSVYEDRPTQKLDDKNFEFFSGGVSNGPVVWGSMSSNLAYGYARKAANGGQTLSVYKPKVGEEISYVVFDGEGRSYNNLVKKLNAVSLPVKGFGRKNSDKVIATLALENKYDAVILKNYSDLGGISPGKNTNGTARSDSVVILNKDKFTKSESAVNEFDAYSNGFRLDTTGMPVVTEADLLALNKAQREKYKAPLQKESALADDVALPPTSENLQSPKGMVVDEKRVTEEQTGQSRTNKTAKLKQAVERNNDKLRRMSEATAEPKLKYADEFKGIDLRVNQKVAHRLIKGNPKDVGAIREAFMKATPSARPASFEAAKRGYLNFSKKNPVHKAFTGSKVDLLGFDFEGNPVYKNEQEMFDDLQNQHTVDSQTALVLADQPETAMGVQENVVRQFFKDPENKAVEDDMRTAVEDYAETNNILEDDGTPLQGTAENLTLFTNNQDFIAWVGDRLRPFFKKLNKLLAGVVAVVSVGAMTIPTDAMAQTGFSSYTQGQTVQGVSQEASNTINWVKQQKDHNGKNFVVADKDQGKIHVVSPDGKVLSTQNALFGKGKGNDRSSMNTPSGRMQLQKVTNLNATEKGIYGDSVLDFVDPNTKAKVRQTDGGIVAMHRLVNKPERRAAINSATASDNYLSHGCINIPTAFYDTSVDSLDGAMVYVLDHKEPKQAKATTKVTSSKGASGLTNYKPKKLFSTSAFKGGDTLSNGLTKDGASKHLQKTLGDLADNVVLVSREDYAEPNLGVERLIANGVEGFYDPASGAVVVIADSIKAQDGLSAEERLAWVAWHELHHRGFDVKFGNELSNVLDKAQGNAFINELAMAIKDDRADNNLTEVSDQKAVEEALSELGAALATDKLDALTKRYGVTVPSAFTKDDTFLGKVWDSLKQIIRKITGKADLTDRQVKALLEEAVTSVTPDKAERQVAEEIIAAYEDPNDPLSIAAKFSIGDRLRKVEGTLRQNQILGNAMDLLGNNDTLNTGHNPNTNQTQATKAIRRKSKGLLGSLIEALQDSRYIIDRIDEQGEGGKLSRSVSNMSNRTQQKIREHSKGVAELERAMMDFADNHRDIFPRLVDKKQVDNVVQEIITALRTVTGGNEVIRKNLEEALGGKDVKDSEGNVVFHHKGLLERRHDLEVMQSNRVDAGIGRSPYFDSEISRLSREIDDNLAIQRKFDTDNYNILKPNKNKDERKHWHGHNGYTMAEAHAKLKEKVKDGLLDGDVLEGLTPNTYEVKQFTGEIDQDGKPVFVMVSHVSYDAAQVDKNFTGEIRDLVDQYEQLSKDTYQWTVQELGTKLAGNANTARWETSTMGKVKEIYTTNKKDDQGNLITDTFEIENPNSIDEIVTLTKAAEYTGHRTGRAFTGGSALEQLTWRIQLTAQQSSAQDTGKVMYAMYERGFTDEVRVYNIGDKDYSLQKGIVVEVPEKDSRGNVKYNADGSEKTKLVKVTFRDEDANAALFGDNIKGNTSTRELSTAALLWRLVPMTVSRLAKFAAQSLTMSPTFGVTNAYKGLKEKQNQVLAWGKDSTWVKSLSVDKQDLFDGAGANTKLHTMLVGHTVGSTAKILAAYEPAAIAFAWKLAGNKDLAKTNLTGDAKRAYDKLVHIYERGGISSRVEELLSSSYNKKIQFALGGKANKNLGMAMDVLNKLSVTTMSQELVSTLVMTDFLENNLGMDTQMAYDANLHFMNFDKRGASSLANYLRNYTMFANAIAQGSRAYLRGYTEMDRDGKLHISKQGLHRAVRNVAIGAITHSLAMMIGEMACPEKSGSMNQVGDLNPYQLMREIPIATGCGSFLRFPVEYGVGMTENMLGVAMAQVARGFWSVDQAWDAVLDTLKDNALPMNSPIGNSDDFLGFVMMNLVHPFTPEPMRDWVLAFGGVDTFGNEINSKWAGSREYKPKAGKQTTDEAWFEMAESFYANGFNVTPETARAVVRGPFQGVARDLLTWFIEKDPRVAPYDAILGSKSIYRSAKDEATVAYTVVMNNLNNRYRDLHNYYIQAQGRDGVDPTDSWLATNDIELDSDDRKVLQFITKYRTQMKNTRLSQDQRYKYNMEFLQNIKSVTHPEG